MSRVTVIVVNYNGKQYVGRCLDGLIEQTFEDFSVWVVDNGSSDGSADYFKKNYPQFHRVLLTQNVGFSAANNRVLRSLTGEYAALLNADAVPDPQWLEKLVKAMDDLPDAGFAASKMLFSDRPQIIDRAGDGYTRAGAGKLRGRGEDASKYSRRQWVFGACAGAAMYRCSMLQDIGLLDEDFFLLYEDVDLSFRAQLRGYRCIFVPEAFVYHLASESMGYDSDNSVYYAHRNLEWTYIQNMPDGLILKTFFPHLLYDLLAFLFFVSKGRGRAFCRGKIDAFKGLKSAVLKRGKTQRRKTVDDRYLWELMEPECYVRRLFRRMKEKPGQMKPGVEQGTLT